jgi:hypothetical protein
MFFELYLFVKPLRPNHRPACPQILVRLSKVSDPHTNVRNETGKGVTNDDYYGDRFAGGQCPD